MTTNEKYSFITVVTSKNNETIKWVQLYIAEGDNYYMVGGWAFPLREPSLYRVAVAQAAAFLVEFYPHHPFREEAPSGGDEQKEE